MIIGSLEIQMMADMAQLQQDMQAAKRMTGDAMTSMQASMDQVKVSIASMAKAEQDRASVFSRTLTETKRLLDIAKTSAESTAESLAQLKIDPNALKIPPEALQNLKTWQEKSAAAIGAGAAVGWDKAKDAWESFKSYSERTLVIWGVALVTGVAAAALSAVYAVYKSIDFIFGLFSGESYKSANIDALIKINKEVETLQKSLPLTAVGASALNEALKTQGSSATAYAGTLNAVDAAVRGNGDELDRLGVKYKDSQGAVLDTNTILQSAADVLGTYKEGWDRNSAAQAIAMGSEEEIHAALQITAAKTQEAKEKLISYGLIIGEGTQKAVEDYQTSMRLFQRESDLTGEGFKRAIADQIMPVLTDLADFFRDGFPMAVMAFRYSMATVTSLLYGLKTVLYIVLESLAGVLEGLGTGVVALVSAVSKALSGDFSGAKSELVNGWEKAQTRLAQIGSNIVAQAQHDSAAMALAWGGDSISASLGNQPNSRTPAGGKPWKPAPDDDPEAAAVTDKNLASMQALLLAENQHIAVMEKQATQMEQLTHSQELLEKLKAISTDEYSAEALAVRELVKARYAEGAAIELAAVARAADAAALQKYTSGTEANIEKLREEAGVQNLNALAVQKITAARQIDKAAADAMFKTRTDEFGVTQKVLAATPQMIEQILQMAQADKARTAAMIDQNAAQKLIFQYDQDIAKLKADSVIYMDSTAKALANLDLEAAKRKELLATITDTNEALKVSAKDAEWFQASLDKINADRLNGIWQSVDSTAHDTFVNIFNGGQDAFTKLRDTLKSTLLDLLYQMTVKRWVFEIFADVTGAGSGGGANAVTGGSGGIMGLIQGGERANSIYNQGSKAYNWLFGGSSSSGMPALSSADSALIHSDIGYTGTTTGVTQGSVASSDAAFAAANGEGVATGGTAAASAGEGAAAAEGAAASMGPWGMVAAAVIAILAGHDATRVNSTGDSTTGFDAHGNVLNRSNQIFGGDTPITSYSVVNGMPVTPTGLTGVAAPMGTTGMNPDDPDSVAAANAAATATANTHVTAINHSADTYVASLNAAYLAAAKSLGVGAVASNFTFGSNDSSGGKARIGASAGSSSFDSGDIALTDAELKLAANRAILTALEGSDLPAWMKGVFDGVDASKLDQAGVDAAIKAATDLRDAYNMLQTIPTLDLTGISFATLNAIKAVVPQLVAVNSAFYQLGYALLDVSAVGGQAAASLVAAFGTVQDFQSQMSAYFQNFRTTAQQQDSAYAAVQASLAAQGINYSTDQLKNATRKDIAAVVDSLAPGTNSTAADAARYAAAVKAANALAAMKPALDAAGDSGKKLADTLGGSSGGGGGGGGGGGNSLVSAFQSLTDAIFKEVERIRGLVAGPNLLGLAHAQSTFAIATAQARAGDQSAAGALPGLSQAMLTLAEANAHSLSELNYIRAQTAASLQMTGTMLASQYGLTIPSFDVGTNYIPHDMIAMLHQGEAVQPRAYNPAAGGWSGGGGGGGGGIDPGLRALVIALVEKQAAQDEELKNIRYEGKRTADILEQWNTTGMVPERDDI